MNFLLIKYLKTQYEPDFINVQLRMTFISRSIHADLHSKEYKKVAKIASISCNSITSNCQIFVIHIRKTYGAGELDMIEVDPEKPHSYAYVKLHAAASLRSFLAGQT